MAESDPTNRFSNRVEYYRKYRPGYPSQILEILKENYDLQPTHEIADIGAGMGHSSKLFANFGCYVYGIEPNQEMHDYLLQAMAKIPNFSARLQSAENTDLEGKSIDFISCGQSFHWFDVRKAKTEFSRILKPEGVVVLFWNSWDESTELGKAYTKVVEQYSTDYKSVSRSTEAVDDTIEYLFRSGSYKLDTVEHSQYFDLEGLQGRYLSSSYALLPDMDGHKEAMQALETVFDKFQTDGKVEFSYICNIYHGKLQQSKSSVK